MRRDWGHHNIDLDKQTSNSLILKNEVIVWMHLRSSKNQYLWCLYMVVHEFPPPNFTSPDWKPSGGVGVVVYAEVIFCESLFKFNSYLPNNQILFGWG